jgi:hypothetical protein
MSRSFFAQNRKRPAFRLAFPLCFGRSDEKKFCLLQVLRYKGFVKQKSVNCYKSFKSHFFIIFSYVNFSHPAADRQKSPKAPPGIPLPGCLPQGQGGWARPPYTC